MPQLISLKFTRATAPHFQRESWGAHCLPMAFGKSWGTNSQKLTQVMESTWGKGSVPVRWKYTLQLQETSGVLGFLASGGKV